MKKSTKGALAAVAAVVLLTGGATTLAFWSDSGSASGGAITSGTLALSGGTCDDSWVYDSGGAAGETVSLIVPGDSITKDCTFTITATGDHLSATVSAPSTTTYTTTGGTPTTLDLDVDSTYAVGATGTETAIVDGGTITEANDGHLLTASFVVTFPYGDGTTINANDTQGLTNTLDALAVSLTQTTTGENPNA